jgi:hypothetical protein
MSAYVFLLILLALVCASALYLFLGRLSRFPCRTIRDVPAFLQPVDSASMIQLLNPETEEYLHSAMTSLALRLEQRRSLHFLREHLMRMSHNAHILLEWSNAELKREIVGQNEADSECYPGCTLPPWSSGFTPCSHASRSICGWLSVRRHGCRCRPRALRT